MRKNVSKKWPINKLRDHPQQAALFGDVDDAELQTLADSMQRYGQRDPIDVMPDGTVVCGHQRVRAARLLGWTTVDVVIRYDLAAAGETVIEAHLIDDNFARRQLSPLARARCIQRMFEMKNGGMPAPGGEREELKAQIAEQLHLSTRTINRYLLALQTPRAVQDAFDRGRITLIQAGHVALLGEAVQAEIADRIAGGEAARDVVTEVLSRGQADRTDADVHDACRRLVKALRHEIPLIQGRVHLLSARGLQPWVGLLRDARQLLADAVARAAS